MDPTAQIEFLWSQGYDGGKILFINNKILCYVCGHNIKFVTPEENGKFNANGVYMNNEKCFLFPGQGVGVFSVHAVNSHFAVAEKCIDPKVYLYNYPKLELISELKGGAKLGYSHMEFSSSVYFATISTLPDYTLTLWNYMSRDILCQSQLSHVTPTSLSFNPGNWRQICVTTETELTVWTSEASDDVFVMKNRKIQLPSDMIATHAISRPNSGSSSNYTEYTMDLPKIAIAGLVGAVADNLADIQDTTIRVKPVSHAWTPSGDVYVGCKGGQLMQIDGDSWCVTMKYNPNTAIQRSSHDVASLQERSELSEFDVTLVDGSLDCMKLHKNGLYVAGDDGIIRLLDMSPKAMEVTEYCNIGMPISCISFSSDFMDMVVASPRGTVHLYKPGNPQSIYEYLDLHHGPMADLAMLSPGTEHVVTLRSDGEIQIWCAQTGFLIMSVPVGIQATCIASSPTVPLLAVGTASGHVYFFSCTDIEDMKIVARVHLYYGPVTHLLYQHYGDFLLSAADESHHIYVIDGSPVSSFEIIGYTDIDSAIMNLSMVTDHDSRDTRVVATYCNSGDIKVKGATHVCQFDITLELMQTGIHSTEREVFKSLRNDFNDEALRKLTYTFKKPSFGITVTHDNTMYGIDELTRHVVQYMLPEKKPHRRDTEGWILSPTNHIDGHQLPGGVVTMSPHQKWVLSQGTDGAVHIRHVESLEQKMTLVPHDSLEGGVIAACFDSDCHRIFSIGHDNIVSCHQWTSVSFGGIGKDREAIEASRARKSRVLSKVAEETNMLKVMSWDPPPITPREGSADQEERESTEAYNEDEIYTTPTPILSSDSIWMEEKEKQARKVEDEEFVTSKRDLRVKIRDIRRTIQQMMRENEQLPNIEQLGHHEFDLDLEEQSRLQNEGDMEVNRIRDEIDFDNLAKMYLRDQIKKECWDDMVVKGRSLESFSGKLEVSNFPLMAIPKEQTKILERVTQRRQMEIDELKIRKELLEAGLKRSIDEEMNETDDDHNLVEQPSTTGSLANEFGGRSPLVHSQFDLHSRLQKLDQIVLLEDSLRRIKETFNREFEEVYKKKGQEIQKIREKNKRIRKILTDLNFGDLIIQPEFTDEERPENVLIVRDEEVQVEKYLTADQKKLQEEERLKEVERIRQEQGDNWRDRGLDKMMGGLLEIKKEDELKKDVPVPAFIRDEKDPGEWNEDEIRAAKEYERKCGELEEEREKFRKQLETELRKLQSLIQEGMTAFDDILNFLFTRKTKCQMVIYQEELKVVRLRYSLLKEEELETREAELSYMQERKLNDKNESAKCLMEARQHAEAFRENYDILVAEDKILDKQFKREFNDCTALQVEQLYKMFRKRPKGQKFKSTEPTGNPLNPFSQRPSTSQKNMAARHHIDAFLREADDYENMPDGIHDEIWDRLCRLRAQKIESETNVKIKTNVMADMMAFCGARQEEDENLRDEVDAIVNEISKLKDEKLRFLYNLDIQLVLKQGQVEVDQGMFVPSYLDSVLIHRSVIEDLNVKIKQLGESKIASMLTSKKSRKGIVKLEWEYKRMLMNIEDLQNKMKDITFMKVSREIQCFLRNKDEYDALKNQDITIFEQTIALRKTQHEDQLKDKRHVMHKLTKLSKGKATHNISLDGQLQELNVTLNERKHIDDVNSDTRHDTDSHRNYIKIVQRRKLVDLAKAQAQEVAVLRAEVERLRMRTFPALVRVER